MRGLFIGIDGGGTRSTGALADASGREALRLPGPAGIVDPRQPELAGRAVVELASALLREAGVSGPVEALCAGLAGAGQPGVSGVVAGVVERAGVARRVVVCTDGEIALEGALGGAPGVLLVVGTGSVGWGRGPAGGVARCGGWGMVAGDEGSAYWLGREALRAVMRAYDGRGMETILSERVLARLAGSGVEGAEGIPPWAGGASKAAVADLAREVLGAASEGDAVAAGLVEAAARHVAEVAGTLVRKLGPWRGKVPLVLWGGLGMVPAFADAVHLALEFDADRRAPVADAVTGALGLARGG